MGIPYTRPRSGLQLVSGYSHRNAIVCARLAQAAYTDDPTLDCAETNTQLIIRDTPEAVLIAFRGTQEPRDFLTDARFRRSTLPGNIQVHRGFLDAFESVERQIEDTLVYHRRKPVVLSGHSLGGALAMLCAWRLAHGGYNIHSVYTFGQPRVGNAAFARDYNRLTRDASHFTLGDRTFRFVNGEDIVPRVPGWLMGYRHAGTRLFFSNLSYRLEINPAIWAMALSSALGICEAWVLRRELTMVGHHFMDSYIDQLSTLTPQPSTQ